MNSAGLSFTEPAGLLPSSLTSTVLPELPGSRLSLTSGVLPTKSSMFLNMLFPLDGMGSILRTSAYPVQKIRVVLDLGRKYRR